MQCSGGLFGNTSNQNLIGDLDHEEMENIFEEQELRDDGHELENLKVNNNPSDNMDDVHDNKTSETQPDKGEYKEYKQKLIDAKKKIKY